MRLTNMKMRTSINFPVRPEEQFTVKDGDGRVVERWRHYKTEEGKRCHHHYYEVEGYPEFTEL